MKSPLKKSVLLPLLVCAVPAAAQASWLSHIVRQLDPSAQSAPDVPPAQVGQNRQANPRVNPAPVTPSAAVDPGFSGGQIVNPVPVVSAQNLASLLNTRSLWSQGGSLTNSAAQLRDMLKGADRQGLNPTDYWTSDLESMYQNFSAGQAAAFESKASQALVKYATHLAVGRIIPSDLGDEIKLKPKTLSLQKIADAIQSNPSDLQSAIDTLAPQWEIYVRLQTVLSFIKNSIANGSFPDVQRPRKSFKVGEADPVFVKVKTRLVTMGYTLSENNSPVLTDELLQVLHTYMTDQNITDLPVAGTDLSVKSGFWDSMAVPAQSRVVQIRLQMEKLRWLNNKPEDAHIEVNLAFQRLRLYDQGQLAVSMETVNGRPTRMSPMLQDHIRDVELNPTWTAPARLVVEDQAKAIQNDPGYLKRNHFTVLDGRGNPLSADQLSQIDWANITPENVGNIELRQEPGLNNALGVIKFNLNNPYAIYLHDTDERGLFRNNFRLRSSGCVRLQKPFDLSDYLLKDDPVWGNHDYLQSQVATTAFASDNPDQNIPLEHHILLKHQLPVYLMDLTVEVDPDTGILKFAGDYYLQDKRLAEALQGLPLIAAPGSVGQGGN